MTVLSVNEGDDGNEEDDAEENSAEEEEFEDGVMIMDGDKKVITEVEQKNRKKTRLRKMRTRNVIVRVLPMI